MNKAEKAVTKEQLKDEERALKELKKSYQQARKDVKEQISALNARTDMQNLQSIIYQKKYQEAILEQIDGVLKDLKSGQYKTMQDFFEGSYVNGYVGSMYNLHSQNIPVLVPVDPKKMERAIKTDSKLSKSYYQNRTLPENLTTLKKSIRTEVTRGIASGKTWIEVAYQIAEGMNSPFGKAMNDAMRIIRTEGHRINQEGFLDAGDEAKKRGADIVKQWDATLDGATRPWHREADGQIREWDEDFIVNGEKMKAPSVGGSAYNVINCRCQLLQRARWSLDDAELKALQDRSDFFMKVHGDEPKDFTEFKQKYLQLPKNLDNIKVPPSDYFHDVSSTTAKIKNSMDSGSYKELMDLIQKNPDVAELYDYADNVRSVRYKDGSGCFYNNGDLEYGYPDVENVNKGMNRYSTITHEFGHFFDTLSFDDLTFDEIEGLNKIIKRNTSIQASSSDQFLKAMRADADAVKNNLADVKKYCNEHREVSIGVQDAIDGLGYGRIWWGHGDRYYNRLYNHRIKGQWVDYTKEVKEYYTSIGLDASNQSKVKKIARQYETSSELWANIASAVSCGGEELENMKKYFPEATNAFLEITRKLVKK